MYNETLRLCPHQYQERLLPTDTVAPKSHPFLHSPALLDGLCYHRLYTIREMLLCDYREMGQIQFQIQLGANPPVVCVVTRVVFVFRCLNPFLQLYSTKRPQVT